MGANDHGYNFAETPPGRPAHGPEAPINTNVTDILANESTALLSKSNYPGSIGDKTTECLTREPVQIVIPLGNRTTAQMKPATTDAIKPQSDLIKFSTSLNQEKSVKDFSKGSVNIPNLSIMLKTDKSITKGDVSSIPSVTQSDLESSSELFSQSASNESSQPEQASSVCSKSRIDSSILQNENLIHFDFSELKKITNNFSQELKQTEQGISGLIGSGGFGEVFVGRHSEYGTLAVKKAFNHFHYNHKLDIAKKIFNVEVKYHSQFRHENIVPIVGFTINGPALCIVCKYIEGGSLESKLAENLLTERQRMNIMIGTAEGLKYLHGQVVNESKQADSPTGNKKNFVHGDVKSANILLTEDCVPKVGFLFVS